MHSCMILHAYAPRMAVRLRSQEIEHSRDDSRDDNPEKRVPVQERHADECRIGGIVERWIQ